MELPTEPTILPNARRFPRTFEADTRVTYYEQSVIEIQIPPMDRTYLTKDNYLEFEMDLSYSPGSQAEIEELVLAATQTIVFANPVPDEDFRNGYNQLGLAYQTTVTDGTTTVTYDNGNKPSNVLPKPLPYFDTNGPHGLFRKLQVYDFRGTTLLEEIDNYDIITALFHHEERPKFSTDNQGLKSPPACSIYDPETYFDEMSIGLPLTIEWNRTRVDSISWNVVANANGSYFNTFTVSDVVCPTQRYTIPLYSFLNRLSQKFVPLHNGFTLRLTVNKPERCISLASPYKYNNIYTGSTQYVTINPTITKFSLKNAKLVTHLLEIPAELDAQVTKDVHARAFHYQLGSTKLQRNVKSLTNLFVQYRPRFQDVKIYQEKLAWRINEGVGKLMYDGAVLKEFKTVEEAYAEAQRLLETTMNRSDFSHTDNIPISQCYGVTQTQLVTWSLVGSSTTKGTNYKLVTSSYGLPLVIPEKLEDISWQGKNVQAFDLRLPGTTQSAVDGIDTTKAVIEYVGPSSSVSQLEIIADFDAFIRIEPGKSSSVAF